MQNVKSLQLMASTGLTLDKVTGSVAAYGLTKQKRKASKCLRVRRSSDSLEMDVGFVGSRPYRHLSNLLGTDGNFGIDSNSDGVADGWNLAVSLSAKSIDSNIQSFTASATNGGFEKAINATTDKIYACTYVKASSANVSLRVAGGLITAVESNHTGSGNFEFLSVLVTGNNSGLIYYKVYDKNTSAWTQVQAKQAHVFNLTQIFGAGNEPTKAQLDAVIKALIDNQGYITEKDIVDVFSTTVNNVSGRPKDRLINAFTNGNFEFGTLGWIPTDSTLRVEGGVLIATGASAVNTRGVVDMNFPTAYTQGRKIFIKTRVRVTNSSCYSLESYIKDTAGANIIETTTQLSPVLNQWYPISIVTTLGANSTALKLSFIHRYYDNATFIGKSLELDDVTVVDMGLDTSNKYYNYTQAQMDAEVNAQGGYINAFGFEQGEVDGRALLTFGGANSLYASKWYDQSGLGNDAIQATAASQPRISNAGILDDGMYLDGTDDYLSIANSTSIDIVNAPLSVSAIVKVDTVVGYNGRIIMRNDAVGIQYGILHANDDGKFEFFVNSVSIKTSTVYKGRWYKLVSSWDGALYRVNVNNQDDGSTALSGQITSRVNTFIGKQTTGLNFKGNMRELIILASDLSQSKINKL